MQSRLLIRLNRLLSGTTIYCQHDLFCPSSWFGSRSRTLSISNKSRIYTAVGAPVFLLSPQERWMNGGMRGKGAGEDGCRRFGWGGGMPWQAPAFWGHDCHICLRQWKNFTTSLKKKKKAPPTIFQNSPASLLRCVGGLVHALPQEAVAPPPLGSRGPTVTMRGCNLKCRWLPLALLVIFPCCGTKDLQRSADSLHSGRRGANQFYWWHHLLLFCTQNGTVPDFDAECLKANQNQEFSEQDFFVGVA